jgi:hypothetical protein
MSNLIVEHILIELGVAHDEYKQKIERYAASLQITYAEALIRITNQRSIICPRSQQTTSQFSNSSNSDP